ncbi:nucleotidyltransferase family protein [Kitasatospora sp. NBC_01266]|uniref:nucleotidyltransferase family protein n=1 Tax=Kitasatospora sp. NBC_01266 TaxID=2903572 RepID=UPI002E3692F9|nr:sugar phosphate nucleotidyltransferase [Kitasatospora sp. NBC_01266]
MTAILGPATRTDDRPPVLLLCGGLGLRQRTHDDHTPKPLRPLPDGRTLLLHVIDYYRAFGLSEFVLCVGYGSDAVRRAVLAEFGVPAHAVESGPGWTRFTSTVRVTLVDSGPLAEKSRRLLDARTHIGERSFFMGYADTLSDFDLGRLLTVQRTTRAMVVMAATRVRARYGELTVGPDSMVTSFEEKPLRPELISAGYFLCTPAIFEELAEPGGELEDVILPRLAADGQVRAVVHEGRWHPVDTYKDFTEVEDLVRREDFPWPTPS